MEASKFISLATDGLLSEIFLRLPDSKAVIQCSTVCKRWSSIVSSQYFTHSFDKHHRHNKSDSLPYTLLLRGSYSVLSDIHIVQNYLNHEFFSEKSKNLHPPSSSSSSMMSTSKTSTTYLDFIGWSHVSILSSFDDLLLLNRSWRKFYICNPLTKQFFALPKAPRKYQDSDMYISVGFVCKPNCSCYNNNNINSYYCNCNIKYKVALIGMEVYNPSLFHVAIFSSETGQWKESTFMFSVRPLYKWNNTALGYRDGILYFPCKEKGEFKGFVAFDPFTDDLDQQCRLVSLPLEFSRGEPAKKGRVHLGVVGKRLRMSQFFWDKKANTYVLKAWDFDAIKFSSSSSSLAYWDLVHQVSLKKSNKTMSLNLVAPHPEDGDVFFLSRHDVNKFDLCQYKIGRDNYEQVCEYNNKIRSFSVFTLVHPWWPTKIPIPSRKTNLKLYFM